MKAFLYRKGALWLRSKPALSFVLVVGMMSSLFPIVSSIQAASDKTWMASKLISANNAVVVDGKLYEPAWYLNGPVEEVVIGTSDITGLFSTMWDENYLYVAVRVIDSTLNNDSTDIWHDDSVEIYIDGNHNHGTSYDSFDRQFIVGYSDNAIFSNQSTTGVLHDSFTLPASDGYSVELAIPWSNIGITPSDGITIGFDVAINDDNNGGNRNSQLVWDGASNNYNNTSSFGDLVLSTTTGDTYPSTQIVYPADVMHTNNYAGNDKRIINVTDAPFNAVPNDGLDDTDAIIDAYEFVLDELHDGGWVGNGGVPANMDKSYIIYIPNGVYNVNDTIIYRAADRPHPNLSVNEELAMIRFIGESRKAKIKLNNNNSKFQDPLNPRAVLSFGKRDFNNLVSTNSVRNLTVDVGSGNPGAIGIKFGGANIADIYNVSILSQGNSGFVGLDNRIGTVVGSQSNITIKGFDYGIRMVPFHFTYPVLEHITLLNQKEAGILFENGMGAVRDLWSNNSVPAVIANQSGSHAVVTDSTLWNGNSTKPAIDAPAGHLFAKNINVQGYGMGVRKDGVQVIAGNVSEYVSDPIKRFDNAMPTTSMDLPIEEVPPMNWDTNLSNWANVDNYPGTTDTAKIQNAMNDSTKTVVYFPQGTYTIDSTITIPDHINMVNFMFSEMNGPASTKFETLGTSSTPLWIMDGVFREGGSNGQINQRSKRTLVLYHVKGWGASLYKNTFGGSLGNKLFANSTNGIKFPTVMTNQKAWFRFANTEYKHDSNFIVGSDASLWVMGYKTEGAETNFQVNAGGILQIMGGFGNMWTSDPYDSTPMMEFSNGNVSIIAATNGQTNDDADYYINIVKDTVGGTTKTFKWDAFPHRANPDNPSVGHSIIIPLYNSYDPNDIP